MNKIFFLLLISLILVSGCQKDNSLNELHTEDSIYHCGAEHFKSVNNKYNSSKQITWKWWEPASCVRTSDIKIFVNTECYGTTWRRAIIEAVEVYNNTNTAIHMRIVSNESTADIAVRCVDFNFDYQRIVGFADFPSESGEIGEQVFLNTDFTYCTPSSLRRTVIHEFGHNLGIMHNQEASTATFNPTNMIYHPDGTFTETSTGSVKYALHIPETTDPGVKEEGSLFNGSDFKCDHTSIEFSENDLKALEYLYPRPQNPCDCKNAFRQNEVIQLNLNGPWDEYGCVPSNANVTVCIEGLGVHNIENVEFDWTLNGSFQDYSWGNYNRQCLRFNVGSSGGTISGFLKSPSCSYSTNMQIDICNSDDGHTAPGGIIMR